MKKIIFIHQNFPGQFIHLVRHFLGRSDIQLFGVGMADNVRTQSQKNLQILTYPAPQKASETTHHYAQFYEHAIRYGQSIVRILLALRDQVGAPDLIVAHPSWGEALFIRDVFPAVPLVLYNEYFDADPNPIAHFDPEFAIPFDEVLRNRARTVVQLASQVQASAAISPMHWQAQLFPEFVRAKTRMIHDGIDTQAVAPSSGTVTPLQIGQTLIQPEDQLITYLSRNLEPHRGFHRFMRALPALQKANPRAKVVIVGNDEVSYSNLPKDHPHWRAAMLAEVGAQLDLTRIQFLPKLPYAEYLQVLQRADVHIYLTYPSVLSWSMMEALSSGALVVASRTAPVEEVITDGHNGLLVDFFKPQELVDTVTRALQTPESMQALRQQARQTIVMQYDLKTICLPQQLALFQTLAGISALPTA